MKMTIWCWCKLQTAMFVVFLLGLMGSTPAASLEKKIILFCLCIVWTLTECWMCNCQFECEKAEGVPPIDVNSVGIWGH